MWSCVSKKNFIETDSETVSFNSCVDNRSEKSLNWNKIETIVSFATRCLMSTNISELTSLLIEAAGSFETELDFLDCKKIEKFHKICFNNPKGNRKVSESWGELKLCSVVMWTARRSKWINSKHSSRKNCESRAEKYTNTQEAWTFERENICANLRNPILSRTSHADDKILDNDYTQWEMTVGVLAFPLAGNKWRKSLLMFILISMPTRVIAAKLFIVI